MRHVGTLILGLCFSSFAGLWGQVKEQIIRPDWQAYVLQHPEKGLIPVFDGLNIETGTNGMPVLFYSFPENTPVDSAWLEVNAWKTLKSLPAGFNPEPLSDFSTKTSIQQYVLRGKIYTELRMLALRYSNGSWEIPAEITVRWTEKKQFQAKSQKSLSPSVLATGNWHRFAITEDGVYALTYENLIAVGVISGPVPSGQIRLHGRQGEMEPEKNGQARYDDLPELPLFMEDGNDGTFGPGDRALFYGEGPNRWKKDGMYYKHVRHLYSDTTYYYVTAGGNGKRMQTEPLSNQPADSISTEGDAFALYEKELYNLTRSGREWYGEVFSTQNEHQFSIPLYMPVSTEPAQVSIRVAARCVNCTTTFQARVNSQLLGEQSVTSVPSCYSCNYFSNGYIEGKVNVSGNQAIVKVSRTQPLSSGEDRMGWLDYITINYRQQYHVGVAGLHFRDSRSSGFTEYRLTGPGSFRVWDVSRPESVKVMQTGTGNGYIWFRANSDTLRTYYAFYDSNVRQPVYAGKVANQDLHSLIASTPTPDMIIVTHPSLLPAAQRLANFHFDQDGLICHVVTTDQIYHEFSAGRQDPSAIRDFVRTYTEVHPIDHPRYLLLFGDGSYDYKPHLNRLNGHASSLVASFQTTESSSRSGSSHPSDYFFVHFGANNTVGFVNHSDPISMAVGRIPAESLEEAQGVVNKIIHYTTSPSMLGEWRNWITLFADDMDDYWERQFLEENERVADTLHRVAPVWNIDRVYTDAFVQSTNAGQRYPEANTYLNNRMNRGTLHMNFIGHGGEHGLTGERVLQIDDIEKWENKDRLPYVSTATCTFTRFDDPAFVSAGERMLLRENKGSIALFSTSRAITVVPKFQTKLFNGMYGIEAQKSNALRLGDIQLRARKCPCDGGEQNIMLFGDPAVRLAVPMHMVITDSINGIYTGPGAPAFPDTLRATDIVHISGRITSRDTALLEHFNGTLYITVFDKAVKLKTRANDGNAEPLSYSMQNSVIFKGKASVTQGRWQVTFKIPVDINYSIGEGKISYYAENGITDAHGYYRDFMLGGTSGQCGADNEAPEISLFLNDEHFKDGGIAHQNPILYAEIEDESGITTAGSSIGHQLLLIIDGDIAGAYTLNEWYESEFNTYKRGFIRFPLPQLSPGFHEITLEVWDGCNNLGRKSLQFAVTNSEPHLLSMEAYPNPFNGKTQFAFEHNLAGQTLKMELGIFNTFGGEIRRMAYEGTLEGFRSTHFEWDGTDASGNAVSPGVYIARVKILTNSGETLDAATRIIYFR